MATYTREEIISALIEAVKKRSSNPDMAKYVKDYIDAGYMTGFITNHNLPYVVRKLMMVVNFANLPKEKRGLFGATFHIENSPGLVVLINPDLDGYRRELYAFHEFTHVIMDGNDEVVRESVRDVRNITPSRIEQIRDGYTVIEEAIAQNSAEEMMAVLYNRRRALPQLQRDKAIPNIRFESNFDYYGLYQPIGTKFARTLRGIGNLRANNPNSFLNALTARAFNSDFMKNILAEYKQDGYFGKLIQSFFNLGKVFRVKQKTFGVRNGSPYTEKDAEIAYADTLDLYSFLEDTRPPLETRRTQNNSHD